jgi:hypothetical protein
MGEHLAIKDYNIKILDITKCQLYPFDHLNFLKKTCYGLVYKPLNYSTIHSPKSIKIVTKLDCCYKAALQNKKSVSYKFGSMGTAVNQ